MICILYYYMLWYARGSVIMRSTDVIGHYGMFMYVR